VFIDAFEYSVELPGRETFLALVTRRAVSEVLFEEDIHVKILLIA